jgi:hypothetical protein
LEQQSAAKLRLRKEESKNDGPKIVNQIWKERSQHAMAPNTYSSSSLLVKKMMASPLALSECPCYIACPICMHLPVTTLPHTIVLQLDMRFDFKCVSMVHTHSPIRNKGFFSPFMQQD